MACLIRRRNEQQQAKKAGLERRKRHVRAKVFGTPERPHCSSTPKAPNIYATCDSASGRTLLCLCSLTQSSISAGKVENQQEAAEFVGELIGKRAAEKNVTEVTF